MNTIIRLWNLYLLRCNNSAIRCLNAEIAEREAAKQAYEADSQVIQRRLAALDREVLKESL